MKWLGWTLLVLGVVIGFCDESQKGDLRTAETSVMNLSLQFKRTMQGEIQLLMTPTNEILAGRYQRDVIRAEPLVFGPQLD